MNHLKTGNAFFSQSNLRNYKYQGQELLETGFYSFKWRNYMADAGRFFNIDVLAEDYDYQSPYAFSENKVTNHIELEGLEGVSIGPGGVPIPIVTPRYGSTTTKLHPAGKITPEWAERGYRNFKRQNAESTALMTGVILWGVAKAKDLANSVLNSESDNKDSKADKGKSHAGKNKSKTGEKGVVYEVPEDGTDSGEVYVGRTKKGDPSKRGGKDDGRDRKKAKVIDEYDPKNPEEGAYKEQKAINERGGIDKLDNKRNEMNPERFNKAKVKYENKRN